MHRWMWNYHRISIKEWEQTAAELRMFALGKVVDARIVENGRSLELFNKDQKTITWEYNRWGDLIEEYVTIYLNHEELTQGDWLLIEAAHMMFSRVVGVGGFMSWSSEGNKKLPHLRDSVDWSKLRSSIKSSLAVLAWSATQPQ